MNVFVEGPRWTGMWTEVVVDALECAGHRVGWVHHNTRSALQSVSNRLWRATSRRTWIPTLGTGQAQRSNSGLLAAMRDGHWDVLLSIQGKIDAKTVEILRASNPGLQVVFWWGDILTLGGRRRVMDIAPHVDRILLSYRGDLESIRALGVTNAELFLFGVSPRYHCSVDESARLPRPPTHGVVLVGTCYPERCSLVRMLRRRLGTPVEIWGRSWRRCRGTHARRAVTLGEAQVIHARARIALNLHHPGTRDGVNMKYFEIPAVGGFQIVDHQPLMDEPLADRGIVTFHDEAELIELVEYYLAHDAERAELAAASRQRVLDADRYAPRLDALLRRAGPPRS
jgi:hypothetical protein